MLSMTSNIALSGINMTKKVLEAVSNNISNADTQGYRKLNNANYELAPNSNSGTGVGTFISRASDPILDANLSRAQFKLSEEVALQEGTDAANVVMTNTNVDGAYSTFMNATKDLQFDPANPSLQSVFDSTGKDFTKAINISKQGFDNVKSTLQYKSDLAQIELTEMQRKLTELSASTNNGAYIEANYIKEKITSLEGTISGYRKAISNSIPTIEGNFNSVIEDVRTDINTRNGSELITNTFTWSNTPNNINSLANSNIPTFGQNIGEVKTRAGSMANTSMLGVRYATSDYTSIREAANKTYGVDMTEELVKLKQYQNLYEANMQVLATSNQMLGTILNIVAR